MLFQEQFKRIFLLFLKATVVDIFNTFLSNQKKQPYNSLKEQQKYCNYIQMAEYTKVNVKLTNEQPKKLKTTVRNNAGTHLRMSSKIFNGNHFPNELLRTTRQ